MFVDGSYGSNAVQNVNPDWSPANQPLSVHVNVMSVESVGRPRKNGAVFAETVAV